MEVPLKSYSKPEQRPAKIMQYPERKCRAQTGTLFEVSNRNEFIKEADLDYTVNAVPRYIEMGSEYSFHVSSSRHPLNDAKNNEDEGKG